MEAVNRLVNGFMAALFIFAAALQYNDPNPFAWMAFYAAAAIPCFLAMKGRMIWPLAAIVALVGFLFVGHSALTGAMSVAWRDLFNQWHPGSAEMVAARDSLGLAIATLWMSSLALISFRRRSSGEGAFATGSPGIAYR